MAFGAHAQVINNSYTYRSMYGDKYARLYYENDYFTATDEFYTQGIYFEYAAPGMRKWPTRILLIHPKADTIQYGLAFQHNAYTPSSIEDPNIRYGDRPYAAALMAQFYAIADNEQKQQRITTTLSIGVIGKIAGGEWMQKTIHKATDNAQPQGWQYQVANDLALNYRIQYEKCLLHLGHIFMVNGTGSADAGTLLVKGTAGGNAMLGYFNSPYEKNAHRKKFTVYLYTHPQANLTGYDATLQGGVFNHNSPYTIPADQIKRIVFENRYGIVIGLGPVYLEYFRYNISKEFDSGEPHAWGGVQAGVNF